MALPGGRTCAWTLLLCLNWVFFDGVAAGPQFMVTIPGVIEVGSTSRLCASLLQPNESLAMTAILTYNDNKMVIFERVSDKQFHQCTNFQAPEMSESKVHNLIVTVRGAQFSLTESRKIMIKYYPLKSFVQTDKPIYLPGQTVHYRVVTLDTKLRPAKGLYDVIELLDPQQNRIGQWLNATSNGAILQLSYSLNSEVREGWYTISVWMKGNQVNKRFKVEKYVLPKFKVSLQAPNEVSVGKEELEMDVCAKYTYGQPVPGMVNIEICRRPRSYLTDPIPVPCFKEAKQTDKTGCAKFNPKMSVFTKIEAKAFDPSLNIIASVEEEGTGTSLPASKIVELSYIIGKLIFVETPKIYNEESTLEGKIKAVHHNDTPVPNMEIQLLNAIGWQDWVLLNLTTDAEGIATFSLNTTLFNGEDIRLKASEVRQDRNFLEPFFDSAHHTVSVFQPPLPFSKSVSSLVVNKKEEALSCDGEETISIKYNFVGETAGNVDVIYLIMSRGMIITQGFKMVEILKDPVTEGSISFSVKMSPEFSPALQVMAYVILPSENVIAHKADFTVTKCFLNKVSVEFSPTSAVPGEEVNMKVKALPNSLCGVSAIDQSVLILEPGETMTADKIFNLLPVSRVSGIPYEIEDSEPCLHVRQKRYILPVPPGDEANDAHSVFQSLGVKVATNLLIKMPSCVKFKGLEYHRGLMLYRFSAPRVMAMAETGMAAAPGRGVIKTVRTFFPETWVWKLAEVGDSAQTDLPLTVPDTITTWKTEAFCLSPQGFGLAPQNEITVFQPFFLELSLPYSIIRGEQFELKATVFNYQSTCMMVSVKATPSDEYTLTPLSGNEYTSCLCGSERKTLSWTMVPSVLGVVNVTVSAEAIASHASCDNEIVSVPERGRIDTVTRSLIVKAEGTEMKKINNWLLCPNDEVLKEEVELELPDNAIDGSARALVSVLGDIMGRALQNLDGLLKMPYGCGEQNMALLAPNIYILQYLRSTEQLTDDILKKAIHFLTSGYQRQLNYKHRDGSYSAFGIGDGNTWLTAFVVRSFEKAKAFIYIDPTKMDESKNWLLGRQKEDGCFAQSGKLFNNRMKGGVSDEVTLSAYITAALLEMNMSATDLPVHRSMMCLKESTNNLDNTYTTALMAYVFSLAGDLKTRDFLLQHLDSVASQEGGLIHWSQSTDEGFGSLSVEIGSYVLLAKLSGSPTTEDLGYASRIVRWLSMQQNYYGGFSSTQDTVVALQALALYSTLVYSTKGSSTVKVNSPSGQLVFDVNQNNKLVYHEKLLKDLGGKVNLEVEGSMCASIQISLHYNIPTPTTVDIFFVEAKPECQTQKNRVTLKLSSLYRGKQQTTNMVILEVTMLSGFVPDPESVANLRQALLVGRVDENEGRVLIYITELPKDTPIHHTLTLIQEVPVQNLKPALVKIYDYYQPSDQAETEYVVTCDVD
ncbi:alpha-2-macroglobulin-like isoform X1 [Takifugu rubripes]|uniref:alpha-2-macroglobulin-like isoform X1 n=1 Tax=Takifugu rubripes TaxID=31033 RepID=UPI0011458EED|nr:alpha-2-macroglobulin-like isoform X1 [Takifugu rubripes]